MDGNLRLPQPPGHWLDDVPAEIRQFLLVHACRVVEHILSLLGWGRTFS